MATSSAKYAYATGAFLAFLVSLCSFLVQSGRIGQNTSQFSGFDHQQIANAAKDHLAALMGLPKNLVFTEAVLTAIYNDKQTSQPTKHTPHTKFLSGQMPNAPDVADHWVKWPSPKCKGRWILSVGSKTYALKEAPKTDEECYKLIEVAEGKAKDMVAFQFDDSDYAVSWKERGRVYENQKNPCKDVAARKPDILHGHDVSDENSSFPGIPIVLFIQPINYKVLIPKESLIDAEAKFKCELHHKGDKPKGCEKQDLQGYKGIPLTLDMALVQPPLDVSWHVESLNNVFSPAFKNCASENSTATVEIEDFLKERSHITELSTNNEGDNAEGSHGTSSAGNAGRVEVFREDDGSDSFAMQQNPVSWASTMVVILATLSRLVRA